VTLLEVVFSFLAFVSDGRTGSSSLQTVEVAKGKQPLCRMTADPAGSGSPLEQTLLRERDTVILQGRLRKASLSIGKQILLFYRCAADLQQLYSKQWFTLRR
jgi:hypothetical protein